MEVQVHWQNHSSQFLTLLEHCLGLYANEISVQALTAEAGGGQKRVQRLLSWWKAGSVA
jgi:hypothetical protein